MGWDLRGGSRAEPGSDDAFERSSPPYPDAEERFALLAVAARGFRPPGFLTSNNLADESDADRPGVLDVEYSGLRQTWSLMYRRIMETSPPLERPYAIYLLGVNPPDDATPGDLQTFNNFYSDVHLVEVAQRRHALRAVRYELVREVRAPYQGAPQFLAVYELNEASASHRRHVGPPYSAGPDVWQRHTTPWRLWYRRLGA
ncbi:MAG: hypothetical protein WCF63_01330 [Acidimicrobiales bacterium]|jgi:hypothetical protein